MSPSSFAQLEPQLPSDTGHRVVLIIEDDDSQSAPLSRRLEQQGYEVALARTGQEGLTKARNLRPDVVLLDLKLPDGEGFDVCEQLCDGAATCGMPVIIVSGMDEPQIVRRARGVGCQYFLRKPYDPSVLLLLIEDALRQSTGEQP